MDILSILEVLQVIVDELDDSSINNLRCNSVLRGRIDSIRNSHYWYTKLLPLWLPPFDIDPTNYFKCYCELAYTVVVEPDFRRHFAAGWFLSATQLIEYKDVVSVELMQTVYPDGWNDHDLPHDTYYERLGDIYRSIRQGLIMADDPDKYDKVINNFLTTTTLILREDLQQLQRELGSRLERRNVLISEVLASNGGWKILSREPKELEYDLMIEAAKSNDIAHYLLIKGLCEPLDDSELITYLINGVLHNVICYAPQNLPFYYREFPEEAETQLDNILDGGTWQLKDMTYTKHTRKFLRDLVPYLRWSEEQKVTVRKECRDRRLLSCLGL
jgi:hypothetical protein